MVIRTDQIITRAMVRATSRTLYLFGDNTLRKGLGGQAAEMRGEPNAVGIVTKRHPNMNDNAFLRDDEYLINAMLIAFDTHKAFETYIKGGYIGLVIPPMGMGLAQLPTRAPKTFKFLQQQLDWLEATIDIIDEQRTTN